MPFVLIARQRPNPNPGRLHYLSYFFFKNTFPFETLTFLQKWACGKEGSLKHFTFKKKFSGTYHTICNSTIKLQERNIQFIINLPYENTV